MKAKPIDNAKLGLFVIAGILFLAFSLYMIGKNRNLFGSTFTLTAHFSNTNGLMAGHNVRFAGIDVGTVNTIEIVSDTTVLVTMVIDKKIKQYIKQNVIATIGTEGLMGNKLINISPQPGSSKSVDDGSVIQTQRPIETDEMLRTLDKTNDNIEIISNNLRQITTKLNSNNSLWTLLSDTVITHDLKHAVSSVDKASINTAHFTKDVSELVVKLKEGEGLATSLFTDTVLSKRLEFSIAQIQRTSENLVSASGTLKETLTKIDQGKGAANMLLSDSISTDKLRQTILNIEQGTGRFNENMEALKHNFLFRKYFKKQAKELEQKQNAGSN